MNRWKSIAGLVLAGLLCAGCTNISLATAQRDLDGLLDRRAEGFDATNGWRSAAENSEEFVDLAARARASAGELGIDTRTKVSFLRIAASAAWKAGKPGDDEFEKSVSDGVSACEKLLEKGSAPPRDCAFLFVVRASQWHGLQRDQIADWIVARTDDPASLVAQSKEIQTLGAAYYPNTLGFLVGRCSEVSRIPGLHASFGEYLTEQARTFKNVTVTLRNVARTVAAKNPSDEAMAEFIEKDGVNVTKAAEDLNEGRFLPGNCPPR